MIISEKLRSLRGLSLVLQVCVTRANPENELSMNRGVHLISVIIILATMGMACATGVRSLERECVRAGWEKIILQVGGLERSLLWKGPKNSWSHGAILVLHGGGGEAAHFCAGGRLVQPQIEFARSAIERGFAVFALDSTNNKVTDAKGRDCGKRFDFAVLSRNNLDLPYIEEVIARVIPSRRQVDSSPAVFMAGLSTGGYMTLRAATQFSEKITAFALISAGDPYGTDPLCDASLSPRESVKGILIDRETGKEITAMDACKSASFPRESSWPRPISGRLPTFKQFQHEDDGIVDVSCMQKANTLLRRHGYRDSGTFLIKGSGRKGVLKHMWLGSYNDPILEFLIGVVRGK